MAQLSSAVGAVVRGVMRGTMLPVLRGTTLPVLRGYGGAPITVWSPVTARTAAAAARVAAVVPPIGATGAGSAGRRTLTTTSAATKKFDPYEYAAALLTKVYAAVPAASRKRGAALLAASFPPGQLLSGQRLMAPDGTISASAMAEAVGERLPVIRATAAVFATQRFGADELDGDYPVDDRYTNTLVVAQCSPGCGKTLFLQTLACLSTTAAWSADTCHDADTASMLNASVPVYVAYNDAMPLAPATYDEYVDAGLATRILYSFFVDPAGEPLALDAFYARLQADTTNFYHRCPNTAIKCCLYALRKEGVGRAGIVLLADDAGGAGRVPSQAAQQLLLGNPLELIGRELFRGASKYKAVAMVQDGDGYYGLTGDNELYSCSVPAAYLHLAPIAQDAAERMLCAAVCPADDVINLPRAVRIAISDACGHPRTLEYVRDAWAHLRATGESVTVPALHALVQRHVVPVDLCHVTAVLAGRIDSGRKPVPGDTKGVMQRIAEGLFVYAKNGERGDCSAQPHLTVYQLSEFRGRCGAGTELGSAIDALLAAGTDDDACGGTALESFLAAWLRLRVAANKVHRHHSDSHDMVPAPALTVDDVWSLHAHDTAVLRQQVVSCDMPVWTPAGAKGADSTDTAASFAFHVLAPRPGANDAAPLSPVEVEEALQHAGVHITTDKGEDASKPVPVWVVVAPHRHNKSLRESVHKVYYKDMSPGPWDHLLRNGIITVDYTQLARALGPTLAARALALHQLDVEWRAAAATTAAAVTPAAST